MRYSYDEIYNYILSYMKENHRPPSVRDIKNEIGFRSTSTVHCYLKNMESYGMLEVNKNKCRTISIPGWRLQETKKYDKEDLTKDFDEKDTEIFDFIISYIKDNGYSPTVREITKMVDFKSTSTVYERLIKMSRSGAIILIKGEGTPRGIKIPGWTFEKEQDDYNFKGIYFGVPERKRA